MTALAVAAISARMLAESARDDDIDVVALDLFGDADTRRASEEWIRIGDASSMRIDDALLLSALAALARQERATAWIAGPGFEGRPDLLERGAALLPLIGTQAEAVRRVRDPQSFFGFLDAQGIAHPAIRVDAPEDATGWLVKDALACGGWHIRRLAAAGTCGELTDHHYFQREVQGRPMSATFIANGSDADVLGFNHLIVRPMAGCPFVFCGAVGPVPLPADVGAGITGAVRALAAAFSLRGLGSLDFMLDGDVVHVLEVNPRPSLSMGLYRRLRRLSAAPGMMSAHVRACVQGELPQWPSHVGNIPVQGTEIIYARHPVSLDESAAKRLAGHADCHDLPNAPMQFQAGEPVCSVSASGSNADEVYAMLRRRREAVHLSLETSQ
ncbi:ATP-grasp domain-containing protein [Variovorax sp. dw_954]|uniref:ATP-grasp domain-containing protein n=1 Tax=Variovorax sp. dw_954 TaxID=2720078 RepID=UPI001BD24E9D|nr:ATP-grasp domain-containing protein [Variovorax sp. dw_954]